MPFFSRQNKVIKLFEQLDLNREEIFCLEGFQPRDGFLFLTENEERQMLDLFSEFNVYQHLFPILTDQNSNYWCIYKSGILKGMVCYLSHDELSLEPKFYNIYQLLHVIEQYPELYDYDDLDINMFDFPLINKLEIEQNIQEIKSKLYEYLDSIKDEELIQQISFSIMAILTRHEIHLFEQFLKSDDLYIVERAREILLLMNN